MTMQRIVIDADGTVTIHYEAEAALPAVDVYPEYVDDDDDDEELSDDGVPNRALDDDGAAVQWQQ